MIARSSIEELLSRASITEVISETVNLRRAGRTAIGLCPFHGEKTPSFHVREEQGRYHCFGCGESGNVIGYVMKTRALSFPDAVRELAQRFGVLLQEDRKNSREIFKSSSKSELYKINAVAHEYFIGTLKKANPALREYIHKRQLSAEAVQAFGIGACSSEWHGLRDFLRSKAIPEGLAQELGLLRKAKSGEAYDTLRGRLIFPIYSDTAHIAGFGGRVVPGYGLDQDAPKYLNSPESALYQKQRMLFGLPQALAAIRKSNFVYIVEGYLDVVSMWQAGVRNSLATCGTALTEQHVRRLANLTKKVVLLFDGDAAGRNAAGKSFPVFINSGVEAEIIFLSTEHDPDTLAREYGDQLASFLGQQTRLPVFDCYLQYLAGQSATDLKSLGAATKGQIAKAVSALLSNVVNEVERDEYFHRAAFILRAEVDVIRGLTTPNSQKVQNDISQQVAKIDLIRESTRIPAIDELDRFNQDLLLCAMAERSLISAVILSDAQLCSMLHPECLEFLQVLESVMNDKERVKELLLRYGNSWEGHWRKAYRMSIERTDFRSLLLDLKSSIVRRELQASLSQIEQEFKAADDQAVKLSLAMQRVSLERRLKAVPV